MSPGDDPIVPDPLRSAITSQHPGIADEIQGAINTLQKLQQITGKGVAGGGGSVNDATLATADGTESSGEVPILSASESFGRYQIVRALGSGAMGAVYLAYDTQLQRHVALKTPFLGNNPQTLQRFYREARAAAQLRSPYICPIYDVGQISGITYLSMAFIDGKPLARLIAEQDLRDDKQIIEVTRKIALGMHKAHEADIIHRDLKPDNIMIDTDGEPIVMDFGLARRIDEDIQLTTPGRILGTPAYMSPEQVDGDPKQIGPATDIYSLGVILYHMLAGRLPFQGSLTAVLRQIASDEPTRPSAINLKRTANSPLERVCLKMMAKATADRYPSMAAVAEALEALLPREAAPVEQPSLWSRLWSFSRSLVPARAPEGSKAEGSAAPEAKKPAQAPPSPLEQTLDSKCGAAQASSQDANKDSQTLDLPASHDG